MGVFIGLIILSLVLGIALDAVIKSLLEISRHLDFLADHAYHSCEKCQEEQEEESENEL